jgi:hypothetical protein
MADLFRTRSAKVNTLYRVVHLYDPVAAQMAGVVADADEDILRAPAFFLKPFDE